MCGILGFLGNPSSSLHKKMVWALNNAIFRISVQRGRDASGFAAAYSGSDKILIDKRPIPSYKFIKRSELLKSFEKRLPNYFIGHTRYTTAGNPKIGRNNHPFTNKKMSLVHNGVIADWKQVAQRNGVSLRTQTDSEIILRVLDRYECRAEGAQALVDNVPRASAFAVAAIDYRDEQTLHLFRNDGRPLHVMEVPGLNSLFFASTDNILKLAKKSLFKDKISEWDKIFKPVISEVPEFKFISLALIDNKVNLIREVDLNKPVIGFLPRPKKTVGYYSFADDFHSMEDGYKSRGSTKIIPISNPIIDSNEEELAKAFRHSGKMIELIQNNSYMTEAEIRDWKQYRKSLSGDYSITKPVVKT